MNTYIETLKCSNKYYTWYASICQRALTRNLPKDVYIEKHHILPKSIYPEYAKHKQNIVPLTAREHFICHWLLIKLIDDPKLKFALKLMIPNKSSNRYFPKSSIVYEILKKEFSKNNKGSSNNRWYTDGINNKFTSTAPCGFILGRTFSADHKNKLKGIPKTAEQKQKQSVSMKGKPGRKGNLNPATRPEVRAKISASMKGRTLSDETRLKMRNAKINKKRKHYKSKSTAPA